MTCFLYQETARWSLISTAQPDVYSRSHANSGSATQIKQETMATVRRRQAAEPFNFERPTLRYRPLSVANSRQSEISVPPRTPRSRGKPKRKRSGPEIDDADYDDLEIDMDDSGGLRKRPKAVRDIEIEHLKQTFDFKAIVSYDDDGDKLYLDSKQDLADVCPELWEHIQDQHEAWEQACGEHWKYDLESKYSASVLTKPGAKPPCVTTKLLRINGGKVDWRGGCEGKYACLGCVLEKRPCFGWDGEYSTARLASSLSENERALLSRMLLRVH